MGIYIAPGNLKIIHYYFFSLGVISLVSMVLFWGHGIYSYLFIIFYVAHSIISWYVSWFVHTRMRDIFVLRTWRYAGSHILLTVWSGGLMVLFWYLYGAQYEAALVPLLMINFSAIFMGVIWYTMNRISFMRRIFNWRDARDFDKAKGCVIEFRNAMRMKLVDTELIQGYSWGLDTDIDYLFLRAKSHYDNGYEKSFAECVRDIEISMAEDEIGKLKAKIKDAGKGGSTETGRKLLETYNRMVQAYAARTVEYDKLFSSKFPE